MPTSTRGRDPAREEEFLGALYKGGELLAAGNIVEAREHLEKAHGLEPKNEKAQNLLGLAYFKLGLFDQASEVYEKLVNENPTDATLRVNLGLVYLKTNHLERSIHEFETATDLEPTHKKAHNYLGLALAQQGAYVKAREHFELAGSDQMAEKMARAISAQTTPSGPHAAVAKQSPKTVVLGSDEELPPKPAPPVALEPPKQDDDTIEVMSDEELPSDVYVVPEDAQAASPPPEAANLNADWGAQLDSAPTDLPVEEMRFAEDEGPAEELPVLEGEVVAELPAPVPSAPAPAWLTMEAAEAARVEESRTQWVTESVADVPHPEQESVGAEVVEEIAAGVSSEQLPVATDEAWATTEIATEPLTAIVEDPAPPGLSAEDPAWSNGAAQAVAADSSWATPDVAAEPVVAVADDSSWATATPEVVPEPVAETWAAPEVAAEPVADDSSWATGTPEVVPEPVAETGAAPEVASEPVASVADDSSWATGTPDVVPEPVAETWAAAGAPDDASWAASAPNESVPTTPDDASWATAPVEPAPVTDDALLGTSSDDPSWSAPAPQETQWATEQVQGIPTPLPQPDPDASPEPSAPLPITVEEPAEAPEPIAAPAGYAPMAPQRLVDLGASGSWVHEPSAGPFHLSNDGLAVTVSGEMLLRMEGLVAVVGSVEVAPESRRRRGRSTQEPFGTGPAQLQRVTGHGVIYLEPGRAQFHAVDLTDHDGIKIDDDGAYLREEYVFAFEEPISFENGRLNSDAQSLELVHLKGNGRVLLQLEGSLRAMPIPVAAPLVVPLHRVVGWFGRVSPRITGFGGRGAVELTGEGYALLGAPPERS